MFLFAFVVLFWTLFDSLMSYIAPLLISEHGFSNTAVGLILASSSFVGALFDFLACRFLPNTNFRRVFLFMFVICFAYPLLLWKAGGLFSFLFAMAIWGVYFDFYGFGVFDFVGRYTAKKDHATSFGLVQIFRSIGGVLAPLIAGFIIADAVGWKPFVVAWVFLFVAFVLFLRLSTFVRKQDALVPAEGKRAKNFFTELHLWEKLGKKLLPFLFVTFFLFLVEALFWTLGPLYAETSGFGQLGGFFLAAFTLPSILVGWFVGSFVKRFGNRNVVFGSLLFGSLLLSLFAFIETPLFVMALVFVASSFFGIALSSIGGVYADYISGVPIVEGEIEALEDFSFNLGYVVGPLFGGLLSDIVSIPFAFSAVGALGVILASILFFITPRKVYLRVRAKDVE